MGSLSVAPLIILVVISFSMSVITALLLVSRESIYVLPLAFLAAGTILLSEPSGIHVATPLLGYLIVTGIIVVLFAHSHTVRSLLNSLNNLVHDIFVRN